MNDLKKIALELLKKYRIVKESVIWEFSGNIESDVQTLERECENYKQAIDAISKNAPTADVGENVHGEWIACGRDSRGHADTWECSECGNLVRYAYYIKDIDYDYCPNCGADMRGEADED